MRFVRMFTLVSLGLTFLVPTFCLTFLKSGSLFRFGISTNLEQTQQERLNSAVRRAIVLLGPLGHGLRLVLVQGAGGGAIKELHLEVLLEHFEVALSRRDRRGTSARVVLKSHVGLKGLNAAHLHSLQPTGDNTVEEREVVGHVHRNSMHGDPAAMKPRNKPYRAT